MRYHEDSRAKQGVFGVCRFNCVSEICVTPTPVAMVTKIWKFPDKNHNNSARILDKSQNFHKIRGFGDRLIKES